MTGLIRKATMMTCWGLLVAGAALAAVPTSDSVFPNYIYMGSYTTFPGPGLAPTSLGPGAFYQFSVTVKSSPTQVVPFSVVKIDFSGCKKLYIAPNNTDPPVSCLLNTVRGTANGLGVVTFAIIGESDNQSGGVNPEGFESNVLGCSVLTADNGGGGVFATIGHMFVATPNEDHSSSGGAVSGADLSAVIGDVAFTASPAATCFPSCFLNRTDFDQSGVIDGADISKMLDIIIAVAGYNGPGCGPDGANNCCLPRIN
jgi:hypothetical protein